MFFPLTAFLLGAENTESNKGFQSSEPMLQISIETAKKYYNKKPLLLETREGCYSHTINFKEFL
jgi:hypothetical protein